jgi:hypothetical protein
MAYQLTHDAHFKSNWYFFTIFHSLKNIESMLELKDLGLAVQSTLNP